MNTHILSSSEGDDASTYALRSHKQRISNHYMWISSTAALLRQLLVQRSAKPKAQAIHANPQQYLTMIQVQAKAIVANQKFAVLLFLRVSFLAAIATQLCNIDVPTNEANNGQYGKEDVATGKATSEREIGVHSAKVSACRYAQLKHERCHEAPDDLSFRLPLQQGDDHVGDRPCCYKSRKQNHSSKELHHTIVMHRLAHNDLQLLPP
mmetsp:Transcript_32283/g.73817  ORF Transcript_32283/g.73817 Transcript_32283/m.73817 type:complete len:208 (-) Transcript_32283:38-661(-)